MIAQDAPSLSCICRRHEQGYRTGEPVAGDLELAGSERGQDAPIGRHRRVRSVERVDELVQRRQRVGLLGPPRPTTKRAGRPPARSA